MNRLNNFSRAILAIVMILFVGFPSFAHDFEVGGIFYKHIDRDAKTVAVSYKGSLYNEYSREYSGKVTIPSSVTYNDTTFSVTSIGEYAFAACDSLTSVTIPNSVTEIGKEAFSACKGLTSVNIPNSVTSIGEYAFSTCYGLTSVTIGNSVKSIGEHAFRHCSNLTSVTIGNSVKSIGFGAFEYCKGLTSVNIPNSVISIGYYAFNECKNLTSVTIGNSVKSIYNYAFYKCISLSSLTIGNSVTSIGEYAFYSCDGLTEVNIPNSVNSIGNYAFYSCDGLTEVTIGNSVTSVGNMAFEYCDKIKKFVCLNPTPPTCVYIGFIFSGALYIPKDSYAKYFVDEVWGRFSEIKKIETLVSSIALNETILTIDKGSNYTLKATASPSNATIPNLTWESENTAIATVDKNGKVTGISAGTATITVKANDGSNVSASCKVTVNGVTPTISLTQTEASLPVNEIMTLNYTITNSAIKTATWSTSNENVAYVKPKNDGSATIVGMADGEAIITATMVDNGVEYSASCKVIVGVGGIEVVDVDDNAVEVSRYDIHGRLLTEPTKGINIIKMSDGSTKKELIK